jgi:hypothetical protein
VRGKLSLIFILTDLLVLMLVLLTQMGLRQEQLIKVFFFALTVRAILLAIILFIGFLVRTFLLKNDYYSFFATIFIGYIILIFVYINENGFNHWEKTFINIHSSWKYFGQILFPFVIASITAYCIKKAREQF